MKRTVVVIYTVFLSLFLFSCSLYKPVVAPDNNVLSSVKLSNIENADETESIMCAYTNVSISAETVEIRNESKNITVLCPFFANEFTNDIILEFVNERLEQIGVRDLTFDYFTSTYNDAVSIIFYNSDTLTTTREHVFAITFSSDFSKVLSIENFIKSKMVITRINAMMNDLYGAERLFSEGDRIEFFVVDGGIAVIDNFGVQYVIPEDVYNVIYKAEVIVGEKYEPVTDVNEKVIALTFDDGPNYYKTTKILNILEEKNAKATFFTVGYNLEYNGHILRRMLDLGCDIGIHSYGHQDYSLMKYDDVISDIQTCSSIIEGQTGYAPYLVRAPFGKINEDVVAQKDYFYINWCVDPLDWQANSPEEIADHVVNYAVPGAIVLLHDLHDVSCDAAAMIIDRLSKDGWRFVTVSELFDLKNKTPSGEIYYRLEK